MELALCLVGHGRAKLAAAEILSPLAHTRGLAITLEADGVANGTAAGRGRIPHAKGIGIALCLIALVAIVADSKASVRNRGTESSLAVGRSKDPSAHVREPVALVLGDVMAALSTANTRCFIPVAVSVSVTGKLALMRQIATTDTEASVDVPPASGNQRAVVLLLVDVAAVAANLVLNIPLASLCCIGIAARLVRVKIRASVRAAALSSCGIDQPLAHRLVTALLIPADETAAPLASRKICVPLAVAVGVTGSCRRVVTEVATQLAVVVHGINFTHGAQSTALLSKRLRCLIIGDNTRAFLLADWSGSIPHAIKVGVANGCLGVAELARASAFILRR